MGGESIKPIRKRIHVYFLMTTYMLISNIVLLTYKILAKNNE